MDKIREKVINFMENNELTENLEGLAWYNTEDSLVELVKECITEYNTKPYSISLASGEELNIVETPQTLTIMSNFEQVLMEYDFTQTNETADNILTTIKKQELYDFLDYLFGSYDYSDDLKQIVDTYIEDITIGNGEDAVEQEVKTMKHEFETMNEKDFCIAWGIYKIGNTYIKP